MTALTLQILLWIVVAAGATAIASWLAHRSYRRFLRKARGPASKSLGRGEVPTKLDTLLDPLEAQNRGLSGLATLLDNSDAFAARALSAAQAGRSLDLMYYIWNTDLTGWLLLDALVAAADRGVRIRLLLDDVNVQGFDPAFLALTGHPLIEVRLFNPTRNRGHVIRRTVEMLLGLARFNRRMHGKLWIADGRMAIIGGRNIGDTYFGALEGGTRNSVDADMLLVGPKVDEVAATFDSYWNLGLSLPILALWPGFKMNLTKFCTRIACEVRTPPSRRYLAQSLDGRTAEAVLAGRLHWTDKVLLLADPPDKAYGNHSAPWMSTAIADILLNAQTEVRLITPYFVPGQAGIAGLTELAARGVRVCLLTNALSATDMLLVYGAYRRYRGALLAAGAVIHEFSPAPKPDRKRDVLHSKVFVIDGAQAIVGSLNFDLRSAFTNTELGLLFEHPALVADISQMIDTLSAPDQAYAVSHSQHALRWTITRPGLPAVMLVEPEASRPQRAISWLVGLLPIQAYL
ncbi:phospholipase D family protein [Cypionkella sp.]|uniref:phospholipase D family protein n=1 Tax=Cypionkella sp. TaxID=2811411 RepID=UPI0027272ECC|nr:phospholipase D family protein [Cypionkella sp.]MDO8986411.1 phospholipase D family protein [Cypionkella sp.]MDP2048248.1 phospholipase D family protein [Cypionkella sp.]